MRIQQLSWMSTWRRTAFSSLIEKKQLHHFLLLSSIDQKRLYEASRAIALDWIRYPSSSHPFHTLSHPDLLLIKPQGKSSIYTVESVRGIEEELAMKPFAGEGRAIIIEAGERISLPAANALLKILEEPPAATLFIMTATRLERVIATIVSRSQIIRIPAETYFTEQRESIESQKEIFENAKKLFHDPFSYPTPEEIHQFSIQCVLYLDAKRKEAVKEQASLLSEKEEDTEAFLTSWNFEEGAKIIATLKRYWQLLLLKRGGELSDRVGRRRFPDETLLAFHEALRALELGFNIEDVVRQLLLAIYGYTTSVSQLSYDN